MNEEENIPEKNSEDQYSKSESGYITWNKNNTMKQRVIRIIIYMVIGFAAAFLYSYFKK